MRGVSRESLGLVLACHLVGCGTGVEPETTELTVTEASALAEVVLFATFNSTSVLPARPAATGVWAMEFEAEVRCPAGGRVAMAASLTFVEAEERADYRLEQIHDDCTAQPTDRRFSVVGAPRVNAEVTVEHDADGPRSWAGTSDGEVEWRSSMGRGRCSFDLRFQGSRESGTPPEALVTGSICGHSVTRSVPAT